MATTTSPRLENMAITTSHMATPTLPRQRRRISPDFNDSSNQFLNEKVLLLVFKATNWNPFLICFASCVCKKLACFAKRSLWKEFCISRAPKLVADLISGARNGHIYGGWDTLAKLLLYCSGCHASTHFDVRTVPGHFMCKSRFSQTSGKSFLVPKCRTDVLFMTDPCEHLDEEDEDVGLFRGIFKDFGNSSTRKLLIKRKVQLDENELCPYCRSKVWSMTTAGMIPRSANRRLGAYADNVEYFICLNGHLNGKCALLPLSDSEGSSEDEGSN